MNFSSWSILRNHIHGMQRNVVFMIRLRMHCEVPGLITPAVKGLCMHCNVYGNINQSFEDSFTGGIGVEDPAL